jgi:hypothetical protein
MPELSVTFETPATITRGEFVCAVVRVQNDGKSPAEVSGRLNLFEGDLRLRLKEPGGRTRKVHGAYQVDSPSRPVELGAGERLESGVNVFFTSAGLTLAEPGEYGVQVEYDPSVRVPTLVSDERPLVVHEPARDDALRLAQLTLDPGVGRAVAMVEVGSEDVRTRLERVATSFPKRPEAWVARLVLAAQDKDSAVADSTWTNAWPRADLIELAHWISALGTPASARGRRLAQAFTAWLDRSDAAGRSRARALAIVTARPFR